MDYKKLQNGSDIRGVALEGIEGQHVNLTEQACKDIGRGFALWLVKKTGKSDLRVAVGRDSRLSGETLCGWLCSAMVEQGLGISIMPQLLLEGNSDGIWTAQIEGGKKRTIGLAVSLAGQRSPSVRSFSEYARKWVNERYR